MTKVQYGSSQTLGLEWVSNLLGEVRVFMHLPTTPEFPPLINWTILFNWVWKPWRQQLFLGTNKLKETPLTEGKRLNEVALVLP